MAFFGFAYTGISFTVPEPEAEVESCQERDEFLEKVVFLRV